MLAVENSTKSRFFLAAAMAVAEKSSRRQVDSGCVTVWSSRWVAAAMAVAEESTVAMAVVEKAVFLVTWNRGGRRMILVFGLGPLRRRRNPLLIV